MNIIEVKASEYKELFSWFLEDIPRGITALFLLLIMLVIFSIRKNIGNKFLNFIDKSLSWFFILTMKFFANYSFSLRYKKHIMYEHRVFNVKGLRQGAFTLEVEKVYVSLKIAPLLNDPKKIQGIVASKKKTELVGSRSIWDFLRQSSEDENWRVLAIIGSPGCGKTTLLQHIALAFSANKHYSYNLPSRVPIFLFLREHIDKIVTESVTLAELAQSHFENEKRYSNLNPPKNWFKHQLEKGKAIILLDGLDEVADTEKRKKVSDWVDRRVISYQKCAFILTSRPHGYLVAPLGNAQRLFVQSFSWLQVRKFAASWYLQNEIYRWGNKKDEGIVNTAKLKSDDLLKRLQRSPSLKVLTTNPLLLTMIATVHLYRGELPKKRVELYDEICDVLLGRWDEGKGIQRNLTAPQKRKVLEPLAAAMMKAKKREFGVNEVLDVIEEPLAKINIKNERDCLYFLKSVEETSGLFNEKENGTWSFAHLSFQEYLTACYWIKEKQKIDWESYVLNSWWHETIRLYAVQSEMNGIIKACLNSNAVVSLTLAAECLCESNISILDDSLRFLLQEKLSDNLESKDKELRQISAEVAINQRLKSLHRIDDSVEIDLGYISCSEYELFLRDESCNGFFYQPDYWENDFFPEGQAKEAIRGVRSADVRAFCLWLTERNGDENYIFRLPTKEELKENVDSNQNQQLAAWSINDSEMELAFNSDISEKIVKGKLNQDLNVGNKNEIDSNEMGLINLGAIDKYYMIFSVVISLIVGWIFRDDIYRNISTENLEVKNYFIGIIFLCLDFYTISYSSRAKVFFKYNKLFIYLFSILVLFFFLAFIPIIGEMFIIIMLFFLSVLFIVFFVSFTPITLVMLIILYFVEYNINTDFVFVFILIIMSLFFNIPMIFLRELYFKVRLLSQIKFYNYVFFIYFFGKPYQGGFKPDVQYLISIPFNNTDENILLNDLSVAVDEKNIFLVRSLAKKLIYMHLGEDKYTNSLVKKAITFFKKITWDPGVVPENLIKIIRSELEISKLRKENNDFSWESIRIVREKRL